MTITTSVGVVALLINLFIPGLGTVIWGNRHTGFMQLALLLGGSVIMSFTEVGRAVGGVLVLAAWVWALVSSVKLIKSA